MAEIAAYFEKKLANSAAGNIWGVPGGGGAGGTGPIMPTHDPVNHPDHYTKHPSGVECIQITEHMGFCLGNAVKYIWRADLKGGIEDLRKAAWYVQREIDKRAPHAR